MSENSKDNSKSLRFFDRIKESFSKKTTECETPLHDAEIPVEISTEPVPPPLGRGIINVPTNSLLHSLWKQWIEANQGECPEETAAPMKLVLEEADSLQIPMETAEIEAEKHPLMVDLLMHAKAYFQTAQPDAEGNEPDVDAFVAIHISKHHMAAWAFAFPPINNGKPLDQEHLDSALEESLICAGIDHSALDKLIENQIYFKLVPIARGIPMIPGEDGSVVEHFEQTVEKTFGSDQYGKLDYRDQRYLQVVHAGDLLCETVPPTPGMSGLNILGEEIPPKDGAPAKLHTGVNTTLNEDKTQLLAKVDGHLKYENGKFHVRPVFYVQGDVDFHVGNIDFLGDVHIKGNVREDFLIHATGTILIEGLVEGAQIEAGKNVQISNGILGDNKAFIRAGGSVKAGYIESATIYAKGDVLSDSIIASKIYSDGEIIVHSGRGTIIGGHLTAAKKIEASTVGCRAERPTYLTVGQMPCLQLEQEKIHQSLETIAKEEKDLERTIQQFTLEAQANPKKLQEISNLQGRKSVLAMQKNHLDKELKEFEAQQENAANDCKILIDTAYPITEVCIGKHKHKIMEQSSGYDIHVMADQLVLI